MSTPVQIALAAFIGWLIVMLTVWAVCDAIRRNRDALRSHDDDNDDPWDLS